MPDNCVLRLFAEGGRLEGTLYGQEGPFDSIESAKVHGDQFLRDDVRIFHVSIHVHDPSLAPEPFKLECCWYRNRDDEWTEGPHPTGLQPG